MFIARLIGNNWRSYLRTIRDFADDRVAGALLLVVSIGFLEGCGTLILIPLLRNAGLHGGEGMFGLGWGNFGGLREWVASQGLGALLTLLFLFVAGQALLRMVLARTNARLVADFAHYLRNRLHRALVGADWSSFLQQRSSEVVRIMTGEVNVAAQGLDGLTTLITNGAQLAVLAAIAFGIAPGLTGVVLGVIGLVLLLMHRFSRRTRQEGKVSQGDYGALAANLTDHLGGLKLAKAHAAEARPADSFEAISTTIGKRRIAIVGMQSGQTALLTIITALVVCVLVWHMIGTHDIKGGPLVFLAIIGLRMTTKVSSLQATMHRLNMVMPAFQAGESLRKRWRRAAEPERTLPASALPLRQAMRLDSVGYKYPTGDRPALADICLEIHAGKTLALCGHSGAGKSTLADLLLGLITPSSGTISIDNHPLAEAMVHQWRHSVAYVPQEVFLLHDTIRENLLWLQPTATEDALWTALRQAAAADFVQRLPEGLDTVVGDRGVRLSGGERQRLALARALLRQPSLLVLDEATSALDHANEQLIRGAIERLHGTMTILIIAHRLSTIRHADQIVVLEEGRIVQTGTWTHLAADAAKPFARMIAGAAI